MSDNINSEIDEILADLKKRADEMSDSEQTELSEGETGISQFDYSDDAAEISSEKTQPIDSARLRSIMEDTAPQEKNKKKNSLFKKKKTNPFKGLFEKIKKQTEQEERFNLFEDEEDFDDDDFEPVIENAEESDIEKTQEFNAIKSEEKTRPIYIEKPGIVIKKGITDDIELEGAPTIVSAEDMEKSDKGDGEFMSKLREETMEGQIMFSGFGGEVEDVPDQISEETAEQELFIKRKEKVRQFAIFNDDDDYDEETSKIGELFDTRDEHPRMKESDEFIGIEYSQTKDSRRVLKYLNSQKKKSLHKLIALGAMSLIAIIISVATSVSTTVGGDRILTIFTNFVLISASIAVSSQTIISSLKLIKERKININTLISISAILCFVQNLLMFVLYFFDKNTVSVFSSMGVIALLICEFNNYIIYGRTIDAMNMCTGENKDKLFSIEGINNDKDVVEISKNVSTASPRIRYSSKTRFPAHLIELCMSETSADKFAKLFLPIIIFLSIINLVIAWIIKSDFVTGFAAFVSTFTLCVPVYGSLLFQLPLRWFNRSFNSIGGMISCQEAVEELCRTNVIMLDSKDLFDRSACSMHGFKDFKNVRLDDAMLYAAAMIIRADGPLTDVFDQMIVNRRDMLPQVKSFNYEEKLGISGWINGQKVIMGNSAMMIAHNIPIPDNVDEERFLIDGHEIIYLGIAHKLAAMMVVDYAPDKRIAAYLKKMRDSGVSILVTNNDSNVTETMISGCYGMRLDNIKILSSTAGRIFRRYQTRPKMAAKAFSIHDGTLYTFMKSLFTASVLRRMFKTSNLLMTIGMAASFLILLVLSILNVVCDLPAIFLIFIQLFATLGFIGIIRLLSAR